MRWMALLLVCAGLALAFAIGQLTRKEPASEPQRRAAVQPPAEPPPESEAPVERPDPPEDLGNLYYQYVDAENRVQFARSLDEVPAEWRARAGRVALPVAPPAARSRKRDGGSRPVPAAVRHSEGTFSAARSEKRADQPDIEIYTLKSCGYCRAAMAYMDKRGLEYTNHDIEEEPEAREEYLEKTDGRAGVPVIDIEGEIMQGWNKDHFETLLASMRQ